MTKKNELRKFVVDVRYEGYVEVEAMTNAEAHAYVQIMPEIQKFGKMRGQWVIAPHAFELHD